MSDDGGGGVKNWPKFRDVIMDDPFYKFQLTNCHQKFVHGLFVLCKAL